MDGHVGLVERGDVALANAHKNKVKFTFFHGAELPDPKKLFNASLDCPVWIQSVQPRWEQMARDRLWGRGQDRQGRAEGVAASGGRLQPAARGPEEQRVACAEDVLAGDAFAAVEPCEGLHELVETNLGSLGEECRQLRGDVGVSLRHADREQTGCRIGSKPISFFRASSEKRRTAPGTLQSRWTRRTSRHHRPRPDER